MSAFSNSAGMSSGPAALLFFSDLIAFLTSISVGGWRFMSSSWPEGGSVGDFVGAAESARPIPCSDPLLLATGRPFRSLILLVRCLEPTCHLLCCIIKCFHIVLTGRGSLCHVCSVCNVLPLGVSHASVDILVYFCVLSMVLYVLCLGSPFSFFFGRS